MGQQRLVKYALRDVGLKRPGQHKAALLLARGRSEGTQGSYAGKWAKFVKFCTGVQREAGLCALRSLPARPSTVLCYVAWLCDQGIKETSLNPYVSAINQAHADMGYPKPAVGDQFRLLRKGYARFEGERIEPVARVAIPAAAIDAVIDLGMRTDDMQVLREAAAVVLGFAFFHRGDTGHKLLNRQISVHARGISLSPRAKTLPLNRASPMTRPESPTFDPESRVLRLLQRWSTFAQSYQRPESSFWALPQETSKTFPATVIDLWLKRSLSRVGWDAQPGEKFTGHSLRKGGASAANAIGVSLHAIMAFGMWKSLAAVQLYISHLVTADLPENRFFGWMLPRTFAQLQAQAQRACVCPLYIL